ncbi:MAG: septum formation protein Maf [Bacteroides sp.]|nr:septum formation protein Maf [Bacteroides sp.]MBD5263498.1 septum formation protein Maf [Bacteroides sp.]
MLDNISKYDVVLASKSPRRKELLGMLDVPFEIRVKDGIDESYPPDMPAVEVAEYLSRLKGKAYAEEIKGNEMVITADTIVILDGRIYGKPKDASDAIDMLMQLQGRTHIVASGVCVATKEKIVSFTTTTEVTFAPLSREEAAWYVEKYRPLDKAGAYGIQEWIGCAAVARIDGSFYNVMGLPVHQLYNVLKDEF